MREPFVETQMLIRKPVKEVFRAFTDPAVTVNFWFTRSSGMLAEGREVTWEWEMYNVSTKVKVNRLSEPHFISTEWGEPATTVDYEFTPHVTGGTYVVIRSYGFSQKGDELLAVVKDNTAGFTSVLDGLKAWLEHGLRLNLVRDKFPSQWNSDRSTLNEWQKSSR